MKYFDSPLAPYLDPAEQLLWSGKPRGGLQLRAQDAFLIPLSLLWCGFAIFWETTVVLTGGPIFFVLWGIPFVCVGLFFVFGRFIADARLRAGTLYGITNERVLIVSGLFSRQIKSLQIRSLTDITLSQIADGSGTITFGSAPFMGSFAYPGAFWPGMSRYALPAFEFIENASEVYRVIRDVQRDCIPVTRVGNA